MATPLARYWLLASHALIIDLVGDNKYRKCRECVESVICECPVMAKAMITWLKKTTGNLMGNGFRLNKVQFGCM